MSKYTLVHDNKLYYVDNGKVVTLEEHYKNEIQNHGNQLLDEVNARHHVHDAARYVGVSSDLDTAFSDNKPRAYYRVQQEPIIQGEARDRSGSVWVWLLAGAVLAGLLVWWW